MAVAVGTAIAYLTLDKSAFKNGIKSAGQDLKAFATGTGGAEERVSSLGNALTSTGKAMAKPSIAAGGFLAMATKTATDFQAQMSKVGAISGANNKEMDKLSTLAREWGAKTKFSATEAGQALEYMGMAGWKTQEMVDGLPGILNLAAASGEELGTTSDIVTDALTAFGLQAKDSAHFADILAAASTNSNTNVSMLGESFKYVAPVAGSLGISAKDTSFALGLMANNSIKGSAAGTALRSSLVNLAKPTKQMQEAMDELGISLVDSNGNVKEGKILFDELREKFSKLSDAQKTQYAATIFGKEAMSGMLSIINTTDKDYNKLYTSLSNCNGQAEKMAETMQDNLMGALTNLKSAFEELQLSLVDSILPFFTKIVKFVTNLVNAFNSLPQPVKSAIGIIIGSIALLSPVFLVLGKLVKSVGSVIGIFKKLSGAAKIFKMLPALITPHTLIVGAAILAIGTVVYQVVKHWDELVDAAKEFGKAIANIFKKIGDVISTIIDGWKIIIGSFVGWVKDMVKNIVDGLLGGLGKIKDKVVDTGKNIGNGIKNGFKAVLGINSPSKVFAGYGVNIGEGLVNGIDKQEDAIDNKFKGLGNKIKGLGDVKPEFADLNNLALSGTYGGSYGLNSISNSSSKQLNFNPNITMHVNIADTGAKGTEQLTQELKSMSETALKNSMIDLFMQDAIRN